MYPYAAGLSNGQVDGEVLAPLLGCADWGGAACLHGRIAAGMATLYQFTLNIDGAGDA
ncbi:hypothetical protein SPV1_00115 [Mariprofundus ferrooxydans PV-1]|uniref:Uncharacterized protein n=1 Tax=Mariprofundus ferrooxydans PV-1 TaxID=314345 RepID=Q0EYN1_9PROT|nr:hypothetical protein SPV1_00115 [Mariprofundus ferrooxydans PV-1]